MTQAKRNNHDHNLVRRSQKQRMSYQEVHGVLRLGCGALDQTLGQCGHDVLHQVAPHRA